jgi:hypothetical protein
VLIKLPNPVDLIVSQKRVCCDGWDIANGPQLPEIYRRLVVAVVCLSTNQHRLRGCFRVQGVWATQVKNETRFNALFKKHRRVCCIFSVNNSRAVQGVVKRDVPAGMHAVAFV